MIPDSPLPMVRSTPRRADAPADRERGSVLIVSLLMLVLITMLALSSARTASFEARMAHGVRDAQSAFHATESVVGTGENWIDGRTTRPAPEPASSTCTAPCDVWELYAKGAFPDTAAKDAAWWASEGRRADETLADLGTQPRFLIEEQLFAADSLTVGVGVPAGRWFYRVTGRGTGGTDDAEVLIQTSYVRRY